MNTNEHPFLVGLGIYLFGFIASYYTIRRSYKKDFPNIDWDWDNIGYTLRVSCLWFPFIIFLGIEIGEWEIWKKIKLPKIKLPKNPPRWL